jgi:hypothetical protein
MAPPTKNTDQPGTPLPSNFILSRTASCLEHGGLVKECELLRRWGLKNLGPSQQLLSFYGWILNAATLNPVEKNIYWGREIAQLNGSA